MPRTGKQRRKRKLLKLTRADKRKRMQQRDEYRRIKNGSVQPVDRNKIYSRSVMPHIPSIYEDYPFRCRDCGKGEIWTARQQKRWYEEQGGEIETRATRCRSCRRKEHERKSEARRVHLEGLRRKQEMQADQQT